MLLDVVRRQVARSLGVTTPESIELDRPLAEIGLDSLLAVEVRSALGTALRCSLPATLLFDYPTLDRVTAHLGRDVLAIAPWADVGRTDRDDQVASTDALSAIEDMSEDDVERLLASRLAREVAS
jgi:myxalamid-type polyketide synthase MxaB